MAPQRPQEHQMMSQIQLNILPGIWRRLWVGSICLLLGAHRPRVAQLMVESVVQVIAQGFQIISYQQQQHLI